MLNHLLRLQVQIWGSSGFSISELSPSMSALFGRDDGRPSVTLRAMHARV